MLDKPIKVHLDFWFAAAVVPFLLLVAILFVMRNVAVYDHASESASFSAQDNMRTVRMYYF